MSGTISGNSPRPQRLRDVQSPVQVAPASNAAASPAKPSVNQRTRDAAPAPSSGNLQAPPSSSILSNSRPNPQRSNAVAAVSTGVSSPNASASASFQQGAQAQAQVAGAHASASSHGVTAQTQNHALKGHAKADLSGVKANVAGLESSNSVSTSIAGQNVALVANGSAFTAGVQADTDGVGAEVSLVKVSTGVKTSQGDFSVGTGIGLGASITSDTLSLDLGIVNASVPIKPVVTAVKEVGNFFSGLFTPNKK